MFVSYKWLEDYVDLKGMDPAVLAEKITRAGIEVEGIEYKGEGIKGVVIGHVLEREQHPNADKLNKCLVDIGAEAPVQIICGAPNVDKGQKVAVATVGAVLPGNFKIKKAKLAFLYKVENCDSCTFALNLPYENLLFHKAANLLLWRKA